MFVRIILLLAIVFYLCACSNPRGSQSIQAGLIPQSAPAPEVLQQLPPLAQLSPRSALIAGAQPADSGNVLALDASVKRDGGQLSLPATAQQASWALWGWYGLSSSVFPETIRINTLSEDQPYYVLLADFAMQRWRTYGPVKGESLELSPADFSDRVLGVDGTFYVALLASDGSQPRFAGVELVSANRMQQPAPVAWTTASQGELPDAILVHWEAAAYAGDWSLQRCPADDPSDISVFTVDCCSYLDEDVEPGRYYVYRMLCGNSLGQAAPGPPALGIAGPQSGLQLSGQLQYDASHPAAGIALQLGNGSFLGSTAADGSFSFGGLSPGLWTLWRVDSQPRVALGQFQLQDEFCSAGTITLPRTGTPQLGWHWIYPPTGIYVSSYTDDSVTLKWQPAQHAGIYEVWRGRFGDPYWAELEAETELTSIALMDQGSGRYYYWLRSREELEGYSRVSAMSASTTHDFPDKGLQPDTIYVIPDKTEVQAGDVVTFTVMVNRTAHALNFVNSVRLTYDEGNFYVPGSFNPGCIGGSVSSPDGIWKDVNPRDGFLPLDGKLLNQGIPQNGRVTLDFNVTPLGGNEIMDATGELFNFRLLVLKDLTMSFQTSNDLPRTYYSDATQLHEHHWQHDDNMGMPGVHVTGGGAQ